MAPSGEKRGEVGGQGPVHRGSDLRALGASGGWGKKPHVRKDRLVPAWRMDLQGAGRGGRARVRPGQPPKAQVQAEQKKVGGGLGDSWDAAGLDLLTAGSSEQNQLPQGEKGAGVWQVVMGLGSSPRCPT